MTTPGAGTPPTPAAVRRVRATLVIAALWCAAWAAGGALLASWRVFLVQPRLAAPLELWPRFAASGALALGLCGLVAGLAFAWGLAATQRGTAVERLAAGRASLWGVAGGAAAIVVLPLLGLTALVPLLAGGALMAGVGALSAGLSLRLAQRAAPDGVRLTRS